MPSLHHYIGCLLLAAACSWPEPSTAQPFVVDDTGLAPEGMLQVESWHHPYESWLVPSAQITPGFDLVGGFALLHASPLGAEQMVFDLQSKWQVRPMRQRWSAALVAGGTAELPTNDLRAADPFTTYGYGAAGVSALDGQVVAYPNAGWSYTQGGPHALTWGLRTDLHLNTVFTVVGEVYGTGTADPGIQAGLQIRPDADWLELNATVSVDERNSTRRTWLTFGLVAVLNARP